MVKVTEKIRSKDKTRSKFPDSCNPRVPPLVPEMFGDHHWTYTSIHTANSSYSG